MFEKKRCRSCGEKVKDEWKYCPYCGESLTDIFEDVDKEFREVERAFTAPGFQVKFPGGGVSITITSADGRQKIPVKTREYQTPKPVQKKVRVPKMILEPVTRVETAGNKNIITIELPNVKKEDIEIKELEQSMEVKAFAGDKAYFKMIPLKPDESIASEEFKNGILRIEVGK